MSAMRAMRVMRVNGLTTTLGLGAAAAILLVFTQHLAAPLFGSSNVLALYWIGCTITYASLLGGTPRRALRNGVAALFGAIVIALVSDGLGSLAVGLAIVLGVVRSGFEYSMKPLRAIATESLLLMLGLGFASWIAWPGWLGDAAALWAFALVQSLYFLVPGRRRLNRVSEAGDPFDRARARVLGVLEET